MVTQRTVALFQMFLYDMIEASTSLTPQVYYTKLYAYNVPRLLLDAVGKRTKFRSMPLALFLYEGAAVSYARGEGVPTDRDRQLGATYLLCFMAVAIAHYYTLSFTLRNCLVPPDELIESLRADGYEYRAGGVLVELATGEMVQSVPLDSTKPPVRALAVRDVVAVSPTPSADVVELSSRWSTGQVWTVVGVVAGVLAIPVTIFAGDIRDWVLHLLR